MKAKELALAHFEKIVLAACVGVFVWLLVSVLGVKPYERKPSQFAEATGAARKHVNDPQRALPDDERNAMEVASFEKESSRLFRAFENGDIQPYIHGMRWVRPFDYGVTFRNEPKVLTPKKPLVQSGRGLMQTYQIDTDGKPAMRKVAKGKGRFKKGAGKMGSGKSMRDNMAAQMTGGGRGAGGDMASGMGGSGGPYGGSGGPTGASGGPAGGGGGRGGPAGMSGGSGMLGDEGGGSSGMDDLLGQGMMGGSGMGSGFFEEGGAGNQDEENVPVGNPKPTRKIRILDRGKKPGADKGEKEKKEDEFDSEPVESREGHRWVELVAEFPHSDQIIEFVKALQESAKSVRLNYAAVDVQRREKLPTGGWTEWSRLNVKEQFDIIQSAIGFESETSPALVNGLAMNVPLLDIYQKPFLHEQLPLYRNAEIAEYTVDQLDPARAERERMAKEARDAVANPNFKAGSNQADEQKNKDKDKKFLAVLPAGKKFGFEDPNKGKEGGRPNRYELKTALIRFWDMTVHPGKSYKYRIRVRTFNPNYKRADVAEPDLAGRRTLQGDWSEESAEVLVESDNEWYVPETRSSRLRADEIILEVHHWYRDMGEWVVGQFPQRVGQFIGLAKAQKEITVVTWNNTRGDYNKRKVSFDPALDTGEILLHVDQGEPRSVDVEGRSRSVNPPREAVSVTASGDFVRHSEPLDKTIALRSAIIDNYAELVKSFGGDEEDDKKKKKEDDKAGDPTKKGGKRGR